MNTETGEIKKTESKPPGDDWVKLPRIGSTARLAWIEQLPGGVTRRHNHYCKIADILEGTPGKVVLVPIVDLPRGKRP